ncbi:hypothetical protein YPPY54_4448, partial [Yersinia pestis PY-54]
MALNV